jgi:hypothetical protein
MNPLLLETDNRQKRPVAANGCRVSFGMTCGLRTVTLENSFIRAEVILDKGANVRQFWYLPAAASILAQTSDWTEQLTRFQQERHRGRNYSDYFEGGWQDVLPVRACWDGGSIGGGDGVGEAAIVRWEVTRWLSTAAAAHVVCRASLPRTGLEVRKRFGIRREHPSLSVQSSVTNASSRTIHFSWTQHPALGGDLLTAGARVWLPGGRVQFRRDHADTQQQPAPEERPGWIDAAALLPREGQHDRFVTLANLPRGEAAMASDVLRLCARIRWDAATFQHAWIWSARRASMRCIAIEPSTTCLRELNTGDEPWMSHHMKAGESIRTWTELACFAMA